MGFRQRNRNLETAMHMDFFSIQPNQVVRIYQSRPRSSTLILAILYEGLFGRAGGGFAGRTEGSTGAGQAAIVRRLRAGGRN